MSNSTTILQLIVAGINNLDDLAARTGATKKQVVKYVQTLKGLGYVAVCDEATAQMGAGARGMYFATEAGEAFAATGDLIKPGKSGQRPRERTKGLRERAWWHFRAHKVATLKELLLTHASGKEKAAESNLYKYILALESVGIIARMVRKQPAKQSRGRVVWTLEKDLGQKPPVWRQTAREIYDPNTGRVFPIPEKESQQQVQPQPEVAHA